MNLSLTTPSWLTREVVASFRSTFRFAYGMFPVHVRVLVRGAGLDVWCPLDAESKIRCGACVEGIIPRDRRYRYCPRCRAVIVRNLKSYPGTTVQVRVPQRIACVGANA